MKELKSSNDAKEYGQSLGYPPFSGDVASYWDLAIWLQQYTLVPKQPLNKAVEHGQATIKKCGPCPAFLKITRKK